jgi:transcriptional regulator with XRE-family HTH domain
MSVERGYAKPGTLAWLASLYHQQQRDRAQRTVLGIVPESAEYRTLKNGSPSWRTDTQTQDRIHYESFNPPALWSAPYSLQRAEFQPVAGGKEDFIFHGGEEILVPIEGRILYHFFCGSDDRPAPHRQILDAPLGPGTAIRINSQIPHHTWSAGDTPARAWMVFRDLTNTPTSIAFDLEETSELEDAETPARPLIPPRRTTSLALEDPAHYALVAWGIAERIRVHRRRANLPIAKVAEFCEIDPGHLSRIEANKANVSLNSLVRIAQFLGIDLARLLEPPRWSHNITQLPSERRENVAIPLRPPPHAEPHFLHAIAYSILPSQPIEFDPDACGFASWIVLDGEVIFEMADTPGGTRELLAQENVIHFRRRQPSRLRALEPSQVLHIRYSHDCICEEQAERDR